MKLRFMQSRVLAAAAGVHTTCRNTERDEPNHSSHDNHVLGAKSIVLQQPERAIERHHLENDVHFGGCRARFGVECRFGRPKHVSDRL